MASSTYGGVMRELPIVPLPITSGAQLARGQVLQWNSGSGTVSAWLAGSTLPIGVATGDADRDLQQINVYCGKGCSVYIKCDTGVFPAIGDFLFWSAPGLVTNTGTAGQQFARAIGVGFNGFVEAVII